MLSLLVQCMLVSADCLIVSSDQVLWWTAFQFFGYLRCVLLSPLELSSLSSVLNLFAIPKVNWSHFYLSSLRLSGYLLRLEWIKSHSL